MTSGKTTHRTVLAIIAALSVILTTLLLTRITVVYAADAGSVPEPNSFTVTLNYDDNIQIRYNHPEDLDWWIGNGDVPLGGATADGAVINQIYCVDATVPFHSYATGADNTQAGGSSGYSGGTTWDTVPGYVPVAPHLDGLPDTLKAYRNELYWLVQYGYSGTDDSLQDLNNRYPDVGALAADSTFGMDVAVMATKAAVWHYTNPQVAFFSTNFLMNSNGDPDSPDGIKHRQFAALMAALIDDAGAYPETAMGKSLNIDITTGADYGEIDDYGTSDITVIYGPYSIENIDGALDPDDKIFLDIIGPNDSSHNPGSIAFLKDYTIGDDGKPAFADDGILFGTADHMPYVTISNPIFYLGIPESLITDKMVIHAYTKTKTIVDDTPVVLVYQDADGVQDWNKVQAFIGLADGIEVDVYGEATMPLGNLTVELTISKIAPGGSADPYTFRLTHSTGIPVNLNDFKTTGNEGYSTTDSAHGIFTLRNNGQLTVKLPMGKYIITESEYDNNDVTYTLGTAGTTEQGRIAVIDLHQEPPDGIYSVTFTNTEVPPQAPPLTPPDIRVIKVSSENDTPLEGVSFTLSGTKYNTATELLRTGSNGEILFPALHLSGFDGTYTLSEVEAPAGYNKLAGDISIVVGENGNISSVNVNNPDDNDLVTSEGEGTNFVKIRIANNPLHSQPNEGDKPPDDYNTPPDGNNTPPADGDSEFEENPLASSDFPATGDSGLVISAFSLFAVSALVFVLSLKKRAQLIAEESVNLQ